ncbi:MAG: hypothetical protein ACXAEN_27185 [Candidatus Thorarchaeota archaeon]|jgi:hypothetical protein
MNNREYLRELVDVAIAMHKGRGMALYQVLGKVLEANSNKINGLNAEDRRYIMKFRDRIRRKHNNEVYTKDDALKFQPWAQFTDAHGWTHIKNMRKHDNVPGERTE